MTLIFSTLLLCVSQLQSPFQCWLGVLLLATFNCSAAIRRWLSVSMFLLISPTSFIKTLYSSYVRACSWHYSFCRVCSSRLLLDVLFYHLPPSKILVDLLFVVVQSCRLCSLSAIWLCLFRWLFYITGSSGCDAVSVLSLLASARTLLCCSLLHQGSPQTSPTPQVSATSWSIGSRYVQSPRSRKLLSPLGTVV